MYVCVSVHFGVYMIKLKPSMKFSLFFSLTNRPIIFIIWMSVLFAPINVTNNANVC